MSVTADDFASVYTDFSGLAALRAGAANNTPSSVREVAAQFEAIFLQMMLKSMQDTTMGDPLLSGPGGRMYQDLFNQQVALELAGKKGMGLADVLTEQLTAAAGVSERAQGDMAVPGKPVVAPPSDANQPHFRTPRHFVEELLPHARQAARKLGVEPAVLIAQSALETGWGRALPTDGEGATSYNMFGIKAGTGWAGKRVEVPTLEFYQGLMVKERAPFRAYESIADSFEDYVNFVRENPRYSAALSKGSDPVAYITGLHSAGYATDPSYAEKVINIMQREEFDLLKASPLVPLY